jgi:hypothetical protein
LTITNITSGFNLPEFESDTVMSQEFNEAMEDEDIPGSYQELAQLESLLGPEFQAAFGTVKDSLRNLASVAGSYKGEKEEHIQDLMAELDQRQETLEDLSLTIKNHEATILKQQSDIEDLTTTMTTEVEARDQTIAELQAEVQQGRVSSANQLALQSPSATNAASSESRIKELEKKLKKFEAENKKQAQKTADFLDDPRDYKVQLIKLESDNQEKANRIQSLEAELLKTRSEVDQDQLQRVFSGPTFIKSIDLNGRRFQDAFVKLPDAVSKASLCKEKGTLKFTGEKNMWWQQTRLLQDAIVVAGTSLERVETINGAEYDCYEEKGKQKRLKHLDENSLAKHNGKLYVAWEVLKETEAEEPDDSGV